MWSQHARVNCVKQRDLNTAFFHKTVSMRNRKYTILRLESQEETKEDEGRIRGINHENFKNNFSSKAT